MTVMLHDSGWCVIYSVERDETDPSDRGTLVKKAEQPFGEMTVGLTRFYSAVGVSQRADRLIEIWRDDSISIRNVCQICKTYYLIQQCANATNEDGLLVTRLTLEETDGSVWEADDDQSG